MRGELSVTDMATAGASSWARSAKVEIAVPRARLEQEVGGSEAWCSQSLPARQRRTKAADALIADTCLAGTNSRRALVAVLDGAVGKDVVSRTWRKVETDREAWKARSLAEEDIIRLIAIGGQQAFDGVKLMTSDAHEGIEAAASPPAPAGAEGWQERPARRLRHQRPAGF